MSSKIAQEGPILPSSVMLWSVSFPQLTLTESSSNGSFFVSLIECEHPGVARTTHHGAHNEDHHSETPAVNDVVVTFACCTIQDLRRNEETCAALRLQVRSALSSGAAYSTLHTCGTDSGSKNRANPKSATFAIGGVSLVKRMFCGFRSRWMTPMEWMYCESISHIDLA